MKRKLKRRLMTDMVNRFFSHQVWVVCLMTTSSVSEETIRKKSSTYNRMSMRVRTWGECKTVSGKSRQILWARSTTYIPQRRGDRRPPCVSRRTIDRRDPQRQEGSYKRTCYQIFEGTPTVWSRTRSISRLTVGKGTSMSKKKTKVFWCSREVMNSV